METGDGIAQKGSFDGNGGKLPLKLALQGLLLMSLALACLFILPQVVLSARGSFPAAFYYLALWVLFLFGVGYVLLSVWASDHRTQQTALTKQLVM